MAENAVQMVQRIPSPRGDKNGADINLALDALEMAFTHAHVNAFAIVSGDSDFVPLVNKLKEYGKTVFIVGGKAFTSTILQQNCHEFSATSLSSTRRGPAQPPPAHNNHGRTPKAAAPLPVPARPGRHGRWWTGPSVVGGADRPQLSLLKPQCSSLTRPSARRRTVRAVFRTSSRNCGTAATST
jgi:hypothetical protein